MSTGASKVIVVEEMPRVRSISAAPTSVAGVVGLAQRGPIGAAILCTSFDEYQTVFGGFTADSDLALAAMGFFENGGSQLHVVRTVHYGDPSDADSATARKATGVLNSGGAAAVQVQAIDAGAFANRLELEVRAATGGAVDRFDLLVIEDGVYRESFPNLSTRADDSRYIEAIVNAVDAGSSFVRVADQKVPGSPLPSVQVQSLAGGSDGLVGLNDSDFVGMESAKSGLHALDQIQDLSLLLVPGRATPAVQNAMIDYCEVYRGGTVFAVLDPPAGQTATGIVKYVAETAGLEELSEYGAIYWPRVRILNPARSVFGQVDQIAVPPSGIVAGVYARTDSARPGGVYEPPAGIEKGRMNGVLGFETNEVLEERKRDLVFPHCVNPLTTGPGKPRYIDGARTLKVNGQFGFVSERRGVTFIERSLREGLDFARHRNNDESLRAEVGRTITAFLLAQMRAGAFATRDPETAFFVDVSEKLNTPSVVFARKLLARVGLATQKPAEWIILSISQDTRALEAELAGGK